MPFKLRRMGFRGTFYFVDHHDAHAASAFLVSPYRVGRDPHLGPVRRGLHDAASRAVTGNRIRPHPAVLPAAFARHLLRSAHPVPRVRRQRRRIQGDGAGVLRPAPLRRHVFDDGAVRRGPAAQRQFLVRFHTGSGTCYSPRFVETFGPPCPDEGPRRRGPVPATSRRAARRCSSNCITEIARWCRDRNREPNTCAWRAAWRSIPSANGRLLDQQIFRNIWVQPAASDAGCALGIPFHIWHERLGHPRAFVMEHAYWGPAYPESAMQRGHSVARSHRTARGRRARSRPRGSWPTATSSAGIRAGWSGARARSATAASSRIPRRAEMKHDHQQQDQVSRAVPSVRTVGARGRRRRVLPLQRRVALHDVRLPRPRGVPGAASPPSRTSMAPLASRPSRAPTTRGTGR